MNKIKDPNYYNNKINELNNQFILVTNEIKKSYPLSKTFQNIDKYTLNYNNDLSNQKGIKSKIYILKNDLQKSIQDMEKYKEKIMKEINEYEKKNKEKKQKIKQLNNKNEGAIGFHKDFKKYNNGEIIKTILFFFINLILIIYLLSYGHENTNIILYLKSLLNKLYNYLVIILRK